MDSSVSPKDEIWFLRVCHHISTGLYFHTRPIIATRVTVDSGRWNCVALLSHRPAAPGILPRRWDMITDQGSALGWYRGRRIISIYSVSVRKPIHCRQNWTQNQQTEHYEPYKQRRWSDKDGLGSNMLTYRTISRFRVQNLRDPSFKSTNSKKCSSNRSVDFLYVNISWRTFISFKTCSFVYNVYHQIRWVI
jgi:hypothetical protein